MTAAGVLELSGEDLPAEKDGLTVQFIAPAAAADGLQVKFAGSETLYPIRSIGEGKEPIQAGAWDAGVPVTLTVSGGSCFFKGGAGDYGTLPPQTKITVKAGNAQATISLDIPDSPYFAGTLLVRKESSAPQKISDGVKIDVGAATAYTDTSLTNDVEYFYRAFAYSPKKKYQTELTGAVASTIPRAEPTTYEKIAEYTTSGTWTAPEDGYYQVYAIGKGGDGGNGGDGKFYNSTIYGSGGGGGGGGGIAQSRIYFLAGDELRITVNSSITSVGGKTTMSAVSGEKGTTAQNADTSAGTIGTPGKGGGGGVSSGGNISNINGGIGGNGGSGGSGSTPPQNGASANGISSFYGYGGESGSRGSGGGGGGGAPLAKNPYLGKAGNGGNGGYPPTSTATSGEGAKKYGGGGGGGSGRDNKTASIPTGGSGSPGVVIIEKGVYN